MKTISIAMAVLMAAATGVYAAESGTATDKPAATAAPSAKAEKSKKCYADADAQKLHGKARKAFHKKCTKAA